jgi:hypothetical protein
MGVWRSGHGVWRSFYWGLEKLSRGLEKLLLGFGEAVIVSNLNHPPTTHLQARYFRLQAGVLDAEQALFCMFAEACRRMPELVARIAASVRAKGETLHFVEHRAADAGENISATSGVNFVSVSGADDDEFEANNMLLATALLQHKVGVALEASGVSAVFRKKMVEVRGTTEMVDPASAYRWTLTAGLCAAMGTVGYKKRKLR